VLNNVVLIGRLTADPVLKYTPSGKPVTSFILAVDRGFNTPRASKKLTLSR